MAFSNSSTRLAPDRSKTCIGVEPPNLGFGVSSHRAARCSLTKTSFARCRNLPASPCNAGAGPIEFIPLSTLTILLIARSSKPFTEIRDPGRLNVATIQPQPMHVKRHTGRPTRTLN